MSLVKIIVSFWQSFLQEVGITLRVVLLFMDFIYFHIVQRFYKQKARLVYFGHIKLHFKAYSLSYQTNLTINRRLRLLILQLLKMFQRNPFLCILIALIHDRNELIIIHHPIGLQGKDELSIQGFSYIMIPHLYILHSFMIY